jgi:peptidoglycan/xylan/chitin deacetylase (PgdA/CDA1 family)
MLNTTAYSLFSSHDFEPPRLRRPGALVVSLDFELHWGVRDRVSLDRHERARLLSARCAVQEILSAFQEFSIHATWASVGFLFARSRAELEGFTPLYKPVYRDPRLDPYREKIGRDESEDPFHFAPSLIAQIQAQPGQEIATHSFSHYYCMEPGQGEREFKSDLDSAVAIAAHSGYSIGSYVFPRNQVHPSYLKLLAGRGISSYRETQASESNASASFRTQQQPLKRLRRLCDAYFDLEGCQTIRWPLGTDLISVGSSRYLRPHNKVLSSLEDLQYRRIRNGMNSAAETGELFHLWWHPEDFAQYRSHNLRFLRKVLSCYEQCRRRHGMLSLSMNEVAQLARPGSFGAPTRIQ